MRRISSIDFLRGFAIILMIFFNYSVTLSYFHILDFAYNFLYWFVFPRIIGGIFIFVSGVAAYVSYKNSKERFRKKYFLRGVKLLVFAIAITAFTYIFVPQGTILFGILHFFAVSSFILPFVISYNRFNLIAGIFLTLFGIYLQLTSFSFSSLFWLGFMPENFFTFDYFPLIPWTGVLLLGVFFSREFIRKTIKIRAKNTLGRTLTFLGKHSLTIYLIHQPILILVLMLFGFKLL